MPNLTHKILGEIVGLLTIKEEGGAGVVFNWDISVIHFQAQPALLLQHNEGVGKFWLGTGTSNQGEEGGGNKGRRRRTP